MEDNNVEEQQQGRNNDEEEDEIADAYFYFFQVKFTCDKVLATLVRNLHKALQSDQIIVLFQSTTDVPKLKNAGTAVPKSVRYIQY